MINFRIIFVSAFALFFAPLFGIIFSIVCCISVIKEYLNSKSGFRIKDALYLLIDFPILSIIITLVFVQFISTILCNGYVPLDIDNFTEDFLNRVEKHKIIKFFMDASL